MKGIKQLFITALLFIGLTAWGADMTGINEISKHLTLSVLQNPGKPRLWEGNILFTQKPEGNVRMVGIAFGHEDYQKIHLFQRNEKGLFFYLLPQGHLDKDLEYRIIINGLWMADPHNQRKKIDQWGTVISYFPLETARSGFLVSPSVEDQGWTTFSYRAPPGSRVYLSGDFNRFDPFLTPLEEVEPGVFQVRLRLLPGEHYYYFVYKGQRLTDPLNKEKISTAKGQILSVLQVPR